MQNLIQKIPRGVLVENFQLFFCAIHELFGIEILFQKLVCAEQKAQKVNVLAEFEFAMRLSYIIEHHHADRKGLEAIGIGYVNLKSSAKLALML